jgi:glycosyltransferase involved in cell wall biosynthesis
VAQEIASDPNFEVAALCTTDKLPHPKVFGLIKLYAVTPPGQLTYGDSWFKRRLCIWKYFIQLYREARRRRPDIYFAKLASSEASTIWLASRAVGSKFVFRVEHDWETNPTDLSEIIFRGSSFWASAFLFCLKRADLVVVQTEKQASALKQNFGIDSVLIPNGHTMPPDISTAGGLGARKSILWAGRTHPMKRPLLFIDLAKRHPDQEFCMIMSPSPEHTELFNRCRSECATLDNMRFIPGVAPAEMNTYYQAARMFVLTSDAEGFSNVIIEALKNGAPVISLNHNPNNLLRPVVNSHEIPAALGYYTNDDLDLTSAVVSVLSEDAQFWSRCHQLARTVAQETFGVEHVAKRYKQEFERLQSSK